MSPHDKLFRADGSGRSTAAAASSGGQGAGLVIAAAPHADNLGLGWAEGLVARARLALDLTARDLGLA